MRLSLRGDDRYHGSRLRNKPAGASSLDFFCEEWSTTTVCVEIYRFPTSPGKHRQNSSVRTGSG